MFDVPEGGLEGSGAVSVPVVGHDRFDGDAMIGEELVGTLPETGAGFAFDVGEGFHVGEPGIVIDGGVDMFIAARFPAGSGQVVMFEPMAPPSATFWDPSYLFGIDMDQLPG